MNTPLILLKNTPEDLWAVSTKDSTAQELLHSLALSHSPSSLPLLRVLIAYLDQLHDFVQMVPPLAWELLEYATEPTEIVYPQKRNQIRSPNSKPEICILWAKQPRLLQFLQKYGPHWAMPAYLATTVPKSETFTTKDCYDKRYPYQAVKTVVIAEDDSFSFIR